MFVITGASGKIGGKLAEKLLAEGKQVKVIARHAEKLVGLTKLGAEAVVGNLEDSTFLAKTFSGAEAVFTMIPPDLQVVDLHAYQDIMGGSLAKAVAESGVKYVVNLSSIGAHMSTDNGPIAGLHRLELRLNSIAGLNVLHLRPTMFMENSFASIGMIKGMGINGSAIRGDLKTAQIATVDIANYAAQRIIKKDFTGHQVQDLLGQRDLNLNEMTTILGKAIDMPDLKYVQFPYQDALQGMVGMGISQSMAASYIEMSQGFNEGKVAIPVRTPANTTPTTFEEFAVTFAFAFKR
jgi:uncharacterized protein YbjT (DUF2867 family)